MSDCAVRTDPNLIMRHVEHLAVTIGERLAGSAGEAQAADYIQAEMERIGLQNIRRREFDCSWFEVRRAKMQARFGNMWEPVVMDACAHTPCTNGVLEAELVYVENASDMILDRLDLKGKVALVHGSYGPSSHILKRLNEKEVAAVIWVDVRYTPDWNLRVGLPFTFLPLLKFPAASVPHPVEWDLVRRGADRVRLELDCVVETRPSQNVSGELPGSSDTGGVIITGHHDSVSGTAGAEDNAAGVGVALALAELFAGRELEKPMRFASFGTEEQLSQGAFAFVADPENRARDIDMVLNTDGQGCWTGVNEVYLTGSESLHEYMGEMMRKCGWSGTIRDEPDGFSDHFPFIIEDVPAAWFCRRNCAGGRWFHHSHFDNIEALSPLVLAACADFVGELALDICTKTALPFDRAFPKCTREAVRKVADGWLKL